MLKRDFFYVFSSVASILTVLFFIVSFYLNEDVDGSSSIELDKGRNEYSTPRSFILPSTAAVAILQEEKRVLYEMLYKEINAIKEEDRIVVDNLKWNGKAKKSGFETGDYISEFKIENLDRPHKAIIYPIAILLLFIFGYINYRRKE